MEKGAVPDLFKKSIKYKAALMLVLLAMLPLFILGTATNYVANKMLEKNINYIKEQTIEKLALYISNYLQSLADMNFYYANNKEIKSILLNPDKTITEQQKDFYKIKAAIMNDDTFKRFAYPFHYFLLTQDEMIYSSYSYSSNVDYQEALKRIKNEVWYGKLSRSSSTISIMFTGPHYLLERGGAQIYIASNVVDAFDNIGIIIFGIDRSYISKLMDNSKYSDGSGLFIMDNEGGFLIDVTNNGQLPSLEGDSVVTTDISENRNRPYHSLGRSKWVTMDKSMMLRGIDGSWRLVMMVPSVDIMKDINLMNQLTAIVIVISFIAISILILLMNRSIIDRIISISGLMAQVQKGDLNVSSPETSADEIGTMERAFNSMVESLKRHISEIQKKEKNRRKLEIRLLQSQIKPHFIKNTLNEIRFMATMKGAGGVAKAITAFNLLMDYNLRGSGIMATVREEIQCLEGYIYLQRMRYHNKFIANINVDEAIMNYRILKLILQPIIENSIIHGFAKKKELGILDIVGYREGDKLIFVIKDNGEGIEEQVLSEMFRIESMEIKEDLDHIGVANVKQRIQLNFGEEYDLILESKKKIGTEVKMTFPIIEAGEEEFENNDSR